MNMEFNLLFDGHFVDAFEFFREFRTAYFKLVEDAFESDYVEGYNYYDIIESLIEEYGSDEDLISEALDIEYPPNKHFTLLDFDENDNMFRVRAWEVI